MPRYFVSEKRSNYQVALVPKGASSQRALTIYKGLGHKGKVVTAKSRQAAVRKFESLKPIKKLRR